MCVAWWFRWTGISDTATVADIRCSVGLPKLQATLGSSYGTALFAMMHGRDDRPLETEHARKSFSAEVNWGVRFSPNEAAKVEKFICDIADYVAEQLQKLGLRAGGISVQAKRKQAGVAMPYHNGTRLRFHDACHDWTVSPPSLVATVWLVC